MIRRVGAAVSAATGKARNWLPLVNLGRMLVTGSNPVAHDRRLAAELERGAHRFVLDIGCGDAPLLRFTRPARYVGLDLHRPSLERARRRERETGVELVEADITQVDLAPWTGADVVVISNFLHHLHDDEAVKLLERVLRDSRPGRILIQDAEPRGWMAPIVRSLDGGEHLRGRAELLELIGSRFVVRDVAHWSNRLRSFSYFLLELRATPSASTPDVSPAADRS